MGTFSPEEILRYSRQLVIPEIGLAGQTKLKNSSVLIVGCGGLGTPAATYLAAAGVGRIGIVDHDVVELSNLNRQPLYRTADLGKPKAALARERLLSINPGIQVDFYEESFNSKNAERIAEPYGLLIDGTDNIPTRYLMNDLCVFQEKPLVYGAVYRFFGQVSVFHASRGPCYRCLMPTPPSPESVMPCAVAGIVGHIPGLVGLLQTGEAVKIITGAGSPLIGKLLLIDSLDNSYNQVQFQKNPDCVVCGDHPQVTTLIDYEDFCRMPIRDHDLDDDEKNSISASELKGKIQHKAPIKIIDLREPVELRIVSIPQAQNVRFHQMTHAMDGWVKEQETVLVCHVGFLSAIARRILAEAGFTNVKNLRGGMARWGKEEGGTDVY